MLVLVPARLSGFRSSLLVFLALSKHSLQPHGWKLPAVHVEIRQLPREFVSGLPPLPTCFRLSEAPWPVSGGGRRRDRHRRIPGGFGGLRKAHQVGGSGRFERRYEYQYLSKGSGIQLELYWLSQLSLRASESSSTRQGVRGPSGLCGSDGLGRLRQTPVASGALELQKGHQGSLQGTQRAF